MPKDKAETYQRIIPCAKREFLEKGFEKASMRAIAADAGMTAAGLYRHFVDKEAMFVELVGPAANGLKELFLVAHEEFNKLPKEIKEETVFDYSIDKLEKFIDYIYDHLDQFKLLVTCAEGTAFADFMDSLVAIEVKYTLKFIESTGNDGLTSGRITPEFMHIVSSAFFSAVFEVVKHDMTKETAKSYIESLRIFFTAGWKKVLSP
ncbi:MAG TPA: TetR/AcrR family transcriptional regulator [Firmicutes bacterium]|jgi:TetR/AcrR family transcriptional regulator|nr:TetR/AcrR family transcriptional regulator [Bacillota bacterium]